MRSCNIAVILFVAFGACAGDRPVNGLCTAEDQANGTCPGSSFPPPPPPPPPPPVGCGTPAHEPAFEGTVISTEPTIVRITLTQFNTHQAWVASVADWIYCTSGIAIQ